MKAILTLVLVITLTGCGAVGTAAVVGAFTAANQKTDQEKLGPRTAAEFGVPRSKVRIFDVEMSLVATDYKAEVDAKIYECTLKFFRLKCEEAPTATQ